MKSFITGVRIAHLGPSLKAKGGIASVMRMYKELSGDSSGVLFIPTYSGRGRLLDAVFFMYSLVTVAYLCLASLFGLIERNVIFHIHSASKGSYFRKSVLAGICFRFGRKVIFHIHGGGFERYLENASPQKKHKIISCLNRADRIIVLTQSWHLYITRYVPAEKVRVIHNPCPFIIGDYTQKPSQEARMVFIGQVSEAKGAYDLFKALKAMKQKNFILHMFGEGAVEKIKQLAGEEMLVGKIIFHGWSSREIIRKVLEAAHILVLPSYFEGLPMSILEAMGYGLAIIASDAGGIPEAVIDGENGFLVKPGDVKSLAEKMDALVIDSGLREKMGRKSLELARERFSAGKVGSQLQELYCEVLRE